MKKKWIVSRFMELFGSGRGNGGEYVEEEKEEDTESNAQRKGLQKTDIISDQLFFRRINARCDQVINMVVTQKINCQVVCTREHNGGCSIKLQKMKYYENDVHNDDRLLMFMSRMLTD
jgi:hypothetical protein